MTYFSERFINHWPVTTDVTYATLQEHLLNVYGGTLVDTMPKPEVRPNLLERLLQSIIPSPTGMQGMLLEIREAAEDEKRALGDALLEDFVIKDFGRTPSTDEVYSHVKGHFGDRGYSFTAVYGSGTGAGIVFENQEGDAIGVHIRSFPLIISGRVQRIKRMSDSH